MDSEKPIDPEVADALYDAADFLDLAYVVMVRENISYTEAWVKLKSCIKASDYPLDKEGLYMLTCMRDYQDKGDL